MKNNPFDQDRFECFRCDADVDYGISMTVETGLIDAEEPGSSRQFFMCINCGTRMQLIVEAPLVLTDEMLCACSRCDRTMHDQYLISRISFYHLGEEEHQEHLHFYMCALCAHEISRIVYTPSSRSSSRGHQV